MKRGPRFVATLVAVALAAVLAALDQTVVATALPHMIAELQGAPILGWVFTAYFLAGSLLCGLATSMPMLVLFRAVQGVGAGSINTMSFIVMGDLFSARERGKWQAVNNIGFATASAIGPSIGGVLSDTVSWRWIFLINVPLCLATLAAVQYGLQQAARRGERRTPDIDWAGALWSVVGVLAILLALTWGGREYGWTSPQLVGLIALTVVAGLML